MAVLGIAITASVASGQFTSVAENFNNNSLPGSLEESGFSPDYVSGTVRFPNWERRYLRTKANYNNTNFIAEVTVTILSGSGGNGMAFFGLGAGEASDFFGEPRTSPTTYVRISPNDFYDGFAAITTSSVENIGTIQGAAGDGTHRVRITWDRTTKNFTVAIHKNYTGEPFSATSTIGTVVAESFDYNNTRIFFGGAGNAVFDNLRVLALDGTPGAIDCQGRSVSGLVRQFGSINNTASALGYASVDALQKVISGFCAN